MTIVRKSLIGCAALSLGVGILWSAVQSGGVEVHRTTNLPVAVQPVNDDISPSANILNPASCRDVNNVAIAEGKITGLVTQGYERVGDVIELYVYTRPSRGFALGIQIAKLSEETPVRLDGVQNWTVEVPLDVALGRPARCAVTVQSTHQFEGSSNAY
jgi:hypothetical protein